MSHSIEVEDEPSSENQPFIKPKNEFFRATQSPMDFLHNNRLGSLLMFALKWGMTVFGYIMISIAMVLFTLLIIFYFFAITPLVSYNNYIYATLVLVGIFLAFNLMFNYIQCIRTPPGAPTQEWLDEVEGKIDELRRAGSSIPGKQFSKYCNRCEQAKPARAHHCHICDKCVLRMDHHCPWVNNCIGYNNHRYFILFLFYLWTSAIHVCIVLSLVSLDKVWYNEEIWYQWGTWLAFVNILSGSMAVTMTGFFGWHVYLLLTNQTTIEFQFNKFKVVTAKRSGKSSLNEYDVGMRSNVEQLFGTIDRWIFMFLPSITPPPLSGCEYPTLSNYSRIEV
ncbi:palmitoyltransferase [Acrasis kona]|uniref:Palmitoyltransferase n=1 Tax=Acrasis kona TaxID=1008807 RepID=A0AAW2ZLK8_9EUKA